MGGFHPTAPRVYSYGPSALLIRMALLTMGIQRTQEVSRAAKPSGCPSSVRPGKAGFTHEGKPNLLTSRAIVKTKKKKKKGLPIIPN